MGFKVKFEVFRSKEFEVADYEKSWIGKDKKITKTVKKEYWDEVSGRIIGGGDWVTVLMDKRENVTGSLFITMLVGDLSGEFEDAWIDDTEPLLTRDDREVLKIRNVKFTEY